MATQKVSELIAGGLRLGKELKTNASVTTIEPGLLVLEDSSGSSVSLATSSKVLGIAYGGRHSIYRPTSRVFGGDEPLTVIWGVGEMILSSDFFQGGSLPAAGNALYAQNNGLWGMSGSLKVGDCVALRTATLPVGGTGQAASVAHVRFNIQP